MISQQRDVGRDGVTGLLSANRGIRLREVSRPHDNDRRAAADVLASLIERLSGRR